MLCSKEDISRRICLGYAAFNKYKKAWNNRISLSKRLLLYEALVVSVLMYNSSCWAAPKSVLEKLYIAHRRHLRSILITNILISFPTRICINAAIANHCQLKWLVVGGGCSDMYCVGLQMVQPIRRLFLL